jgi:photosystem II stability/assembly factor-like uncharacterized protein
MNNHTSRLFALAAASLCIIGTGCSISFTTSGTVDGGMYRSEDAGTTWTQAVNAGTTAKGKAVRIDGLNVNFVRFDPSNVNVLYISTNSGMYRSEKNGDLWVKLGLPGASYGAFTIDPTATSIMYAASGSTIYKSTDTGAHWTVVYLESKPDRSFTNLAVHPTNTSYVYAGTNRGEILLSKDFGNTWQLYATLDAVDPIRNMLFASGNTTMFILTQSKGLYKSVDGGATWVSLSPTLAKFKSANSITSLATLPNKPDVLYIATGYGLLMTTDGGTSWQPIQTLVPFSSQPIQFVAVNPQNPSIIYVIVGNRVRKSLDGGKTWDAKIVVPTARNLSALVLNTGKPDELFIGTVKPTKK